MAIVRFHQKALITNNTGQLLALRASYKGKRWDLPGGAVEIPELHDIALRRELLEETGIEAVDVVPVVVETNYDMDADAYVLFVGYHGNYNGGEIRLSSEHLAFRWMTPPEFLRSDAIPYLRDFVRLWLETRRQN
jgi:8-oxo-dGTP diphosphatase